MGVARRFRHTPGEYRIIVAGNRPIPMSGRARVRCLTLRNGPTYHPPDDERAARHRAQAGSCAFRGRMSTRGPAERIAHRPDEADLPAQEAASREGAWLPRADAHG